MPNRPAYKAKTTKGYYSSRKASQSESYRVNVAKWGVASSIAADYRKMDGLMLQDFRSPENVGESASKCCLG